MSGFEATPGELEVAAGSLRAMGGEAGVLGSGGLAVAELSGSMEAMCARAQGLPYILTGPGTRPSTVMSGNFSGGTRFIAPDSRGATFDASGRFRYFGEY